MRFYIPKRKKHSPFRIQEPIHPSKNEYLRIMIGATLLKPIHRHRLIFRSPFLEIDLKFEVVHLLTSNEASFFPC